MARLSQEKIDEVRSSVNIVDVIGEHLSLTKSGRNYKAICPFHADTHPSLSISEEKQIFNCFVCGTGGNVFTFLQKHLGISYIEAVKEVANKGHVDLSEYQLDSAPIVHKNQALYDLNKKAEEIYSYYLHTKVGIPALDYLKNRDFTEEIIKAFNIGYAPSTNVLTSSFKQLNIEQIDMFNSGLIIESSSPIDRFNNRIMFPIHNHNGEVVGFSGRIFNQDNEAKYINSPESEIFIKGDILYHYYLAKEAIRKNDSVYILEGFMDVIAMYKAGINNTVAIMGTALTKNHLNAIKRLTNNVVLCLDGDKAGQAAMNKYADMLNEAKFNTKICVLPDSLDPDEVYIKHGKDGLINALNKTKSLVEFKMDYEYSLINTNNFDDKKQYLDKIVNVLVNVKDDLDVDFYVGLLATKTGFFKEIIQSRLSGKKMNIHEKVHDVVKNTNQLLDKYHKAEHDLIYYMLQDKHVSDLYEKKAGFMYNDEYRLLASYIVDYYRSHNVMNIADLISALNDDHLINLLTSIDNTSLPSTIDDEIIDDYIDTIASNAKQLKKQELISTFNNVLDPIEQSKILSEIIKLK